MILLSRLVLVVFRRTSRCVLQIPGGPVHMASYDFPQHWHAPAREVDVLRLLSQSGEVLLRMFSIMRGGQTRLVSC